MNFFHNHIAVPLMHVKKCQGVKKADASKEPKPAKEAGCIDGLR